MRQLNSYLVTFFVSGNPEFANLYFYFASGNSDLLFFCIIHVHL
jgi:hypothetical protein